MARPEGTLKLSSNIEPQVGAPLDARAIVGTVADLTVAGNFTYSYVGMIVSVQATGDVYILKAKPTTVEDNWGKVAAGGDMDAYYTKAEIDAGWYDKQQVDQLITKVYKPAGSATLATLPELTSAVVGNVYDMSEAFETTSDFVEGAGKTYPIGTNVVVADLGTYSTVSPVGDEDPSDLGWYEIKNDVYVLSADTEVDSEKTYYTYTANIKFDVLPGFIDLSHYLMQVSELPEASLAEVGKIYQYVGTTTSTLTNGFFYTCKEGGTSSDDPSSEGWYEYDAVADEYAVSADTEVDSEKTYYTLVADSSVQPSENPATEGYFELDGTTYTKSTDSTVDGSKTYYLITATEVQTGTYEWVAKPVQDVSGAGQLNDELVVSESAGGISVGTTYNEGTSFETLWRDLLNPLTNPVLVAPSATLTTVASKLLEVGDSITATLTAVLNRGSITPANGTSGYRSGLADSYSLNGGATQVSGEFADVTVDEDHDSFTATITYEAGEQPKDSRGGDYDSPLAAGSVTSPALTFEFVNALWANTASISTVAKLALVSASAGVKEFNFPAATIANPEVFDVPASWTVTGVEVYNTLSGTWETCASEFSVTDTVHDDAAGTETNYKRYTCNLGYDMGARRIRFKWS